MTTFQKLINGRSVFGVVGDGRQVIDLGVVVVNDAHAALATTESQFRLTIPAGHAAYTRLLEMFGGDLRAQSAKVWADIQIGDYTAAARIPSRPPPHPRWPPPSSGPSASSARPTTLTVTAPPRTPAIRPTSATAPRWSSRRTGRPASASRAAPPNRFTPVPRSPTSTRSSPGDLLFIPGSNGTPQRPGHVGMAVGDGLLVQAPHTGDVVKISKVSQWANQISIIRRVAKADL